MKKYVVNLCGVLIIVLMTLFIIDDYSIYTVKKSNIESNSLKVALENGMRNATIIKTDDQKSSLVTVLKGQEEYGVVVYSKSIIYGYYRIEKAIYRINGAEEEYNTAVVDPVNVYVLTLKPNESGDIFVAVQAKKAGWQERIGFTILFLTVSTIGIFYRKHEHNRRL